MIKVIILRDSIRQCDYRRKELGLSPIECIMISDSLGRGIEMRIKGLYIDVVKGAIELDGLTREDFERYYHGMYKKRVLKKSSLAGAKLKIIRGYLEGNEIEIEDWFERVVGCNWKQAALSNPAALNYLKTHAEHYNCAARDTFTVLYGKIGGLGYLVNVHELRVPFDYDFFSDYTYEELWVE